MITTMTRNVTRTALEAWLQAVRLPVDAVVRATGADSGPIDRADAAVRRAVAELTGDEVLLASATKREAVLDLRDHAAEQKAQAEQLRVEADRRRVEAENNARRTAEAADARAKQVEEERQRRKAKERETLAAVTERDRKASASRKRQDDKRRLAAESQAVSAEQAAAAAKLRKVQLADAEKALSRK